MSSLLITQVKSANGTNAKQRGTLESLGLRGINRRLYDAGLQFANGAAAAPANLHITLAAFALGLLQLPFLINLGMSLCRGAPAGDNPWDATTLEWQTTSPPPHGNFATAPRVRCGAYEYSVSGEPRDFVPQGESV